MSLPLQLGSQNIMKAVAKEDAIVNESALHDSVARRSTAQGAARDFEQGITLFGDMPGFAVAVGILLLVIMIHLLHSFGAGGMPCALAGIE